MTVRYQAPWHRQSFDRFLHERLPQLLAERMPLAGYRAQFTGPHTCRINLSVSARSGAVDVEYTDVPAPDEEGVFHLGDRRFVCPPSASSEALDTAEIRCVGEQFLDFLAERLGSGASDLSWDEALVRSWLPLRAWMLEFLRGSDSLRPWSTEAEPHGQPLDETNWLSRQTHLRRLIVPNRKKLFTQGQIGRTCPIETPEGTNIGRVLSIAQGAKIRDGELVVVDDRPEAAFGLSASMIPFIEHSDTNRTLMGANMMRQWLNPPDPEPALVQTGHEPPIDAFWCGRNLLTAFVSWGEDTFEDALTISESAAAKLGYPKPLEPGDKLSNRHGSKGIVSRILPDEQMPHLPDGTAVEIICSFMGCHTRLHFGQLLEALLGRIARIEGKPAVAPPFAAPPRDEIRRQLVECGLPESGMETLTLGRSGAKLARPSTVGWVYWGKTDHCVADKIHAHACGLRANRQGHTEYVNLRENRAYETIRETYHLRSTENPEAQNLCDRLAEGPVSMPEPPSPSFRDLQRRLRIAGIELLLSGQALTCRFREPAEPVLPLASPIPHPWIEDRQIRTVGRFDGLPEFADVLVANARLLQMIESQTPQRLVQDATDRLRAAVEGYFDALVPGEDREGKDWRLWPHPDFYRYAVLRLDAMVLFSGRSVIAPASDLHLDQLGLPDPIAWTLFGPLVIRELGDRRAVESRSAEAAAALDRVMARNWLILHRAPSIQPTSHIAFRPVRIPEKVIRIHSLVCRWLNADYDGDQSAVFLPITEAGQREAAEHLSVMGHLRQDPALLADLAPTQEM
ncbi:MAG: hypothetical protein GXY33_13795, partial [Phycisphaerae bacterium]|nr:hypothetical protein [Phycisphaerae bacterium]